MANAENVLVFGPPGVGKAHLAIGIGRATVEQGHSVLFVSATTLIAGLARAEAEGKLDAKLTFFAKPKLLIIDELGYLPFEKRAAHLFFQARGAPLRAWGTARHHQPGRLAVGRSVWR